MTHLFAYAAITFIITRAGIFRWLREIGPKSWRDFISCPLCTGFWVGTVLHAATNASALIHSRSWGLALGALGAVEAGALTGLAALLFACAVDWLDASEQLSTALRPKKAVIRSSFPDEAPTDPDAYPGPTKKVSEQTITEAIKRMGEKKS